jgi:hypothetical protein
MKTLRRFWEWAIAEKPDEELRARRMNENLSDTASEAICLALDAFDCRESGGWSNPEALRDLSLALCEALERMHEQVPARVSASVRWVNPQQMAERYPTSLLPGPVFSPVKPVVFPPNRGVALEEGQGLSMRLPPWFLEHQSVGAKLRGDREGELLLHTRSPLADAYEIAFCAPRKGNYDVTIADMNGTRGYLVELERGHCKWVKVGSVDDVDQPL